MFIVNCPQLCLSSFSENQSPLQNPPKQLWIPHKVQQIWGTPQQPFPTLKCIDSSGSKPAWELLMVKLRPGRVWGWADWGETEVYTALTHTDFMNWLLGVNGMVHKNSGDPDPLFLRTCNFEAWLGLLSNGMSPFVFGGLCVTVSAVFLVGELFSNLNFGF